MNPGFHKCSKEGSHWPTVIPGRSKDKTSVHWDTYHTFKATSLTVTTIDGV